MAEVVEWLLEDYHDGEGGKARQEPRFKLACRIFFFGDDDFEGEGTLVDISTRGCRSSSFIDLQPGMVLKLSLFLPDFNWPARVDEAIVRWVQGHNFGLEFTSIRPSMRRRILMLVTKLAPPAPSRQLNDLPGQR